MFLDNTSILAKYWSNKISQGIKANHRRKITEGVAPTRFSPLGYKYDKEKKQHIIDEATKNLVHYIFDLFNSKKLSIGQLCDQLIKEGYGSLAGTCWSRSGLHNLLRNLFYTGEFIYKGKIYKGNHKPYITKTQYKARLEHMNNKYVSKKETNIDYLFRNMLRSGISGRIITGDMKIGAHNSGIYIYYVQPKPEFLSIKEGTIFELLNREIEKIAYSEEFAEFTKQVFRDAVAEQAKNQAKNLSFITKKITRIEK